VKKVILYIPIGINSGFPLVLQFSNCEKSEEFMSEYKKLVLPLLSVVENKGNFVELSSNDSNDTLINEAGIPSDVSKT
jgi:hypothetical protein